MAGRRRKSGARTKSGRLSRAKTVTYDRGAERTALKYSIYGPDGSDAIGRAYHHGLLGDEGVNLRNAARAVGRTYWPMLAVGRYKCAIADNVGGGSSVESEQTKRRERWLTETLRMVNGMGWDVRRAFDELVIDVFPDEGPAWLDRLIAKRPLEADRNKLELALSALRIVAKERG